MRGFVLTKRRMYNQIFSVFTLNSGLIDNLNVYTPVGNSVTSSH